MLKMLLPAAQTTFHYNWATTVSQMENRTDLYLSTLQNFIEAMGGRLELYAVFEDGRVKLTQELG